MQLIKNGGNALAIQCFADHPGQPLEAPKDQDRKKKGGGKTVSSYFKGQLEGVLASAEQDRANKDDQIRTLKDEIAHQGDMIAKLSKEKRSVGDSRQKTEEDIQAAEDKCNHLSRVKGKLEQALDEAEDAL